MIVVVGEGVDCRGGRGRHRAKASVVVLPADRGDCKGWQGMTEREGEREASVHWEMERRWQRERSRERERERETYLERGSEWHGVKGRFPGQT